MNSINIELVKKLANLDVDVIDIDSFRKNYKQVRNIVHNYEWLENVKKIPALYKNKKEVISFVEQHKTILQKFVDANVLYELTNGFEINYHWVDIYRFVLEDINKTGKEKVLRVLSYLESKNFKDIKFVKDFPNIFYERIYQKHNTNLYEVSYCFSDGDKKYLARYHYDSYPVVFENSKIILIFKENNSLNNVNIAYLSSFDIDLENIDFYDDVDKILKELPVDKIDDFSTMCEYLRNIDKNINLLHLNKDILEKDVKNNDLSSFYKKEYDKLNKQLEDLNSQRDYILKEYGKLGYPRDFVEFNLKYLKQMEWESSIHWD